jgi:hypothetical protein
VSSFYDAFIVSNCMKTAIEFLAKWIGMNLEGSERGLIDVPSWHFVGRAGEIHGKSSGRIAYVHTKIRTGYFSHTRILLQTHGGGNPRTCDTLSLVRMKVRDYDIKAWVRGQRKMSQVLGASGLLDFAMLRPRPILPWRAFWNLWTVYFINLPVFFRSR